MAERTGKSSLPVGLQKRLKEFAASEARTLELASHALRKGMEAVLGGRDLSDSITVNYEDCEYQLFIKKEGEGQIDFKVRPTTPEQSREQQIFSLLADNTVKNEYGRIHTDAKNIRELTELVEFLRDGIARPN